MFALENEVRGDLLLGDMGQGLGLRSGVIDGAISILSGSVKSFHVKIVFSIGCGNADKSSHNPRLRLKAFFGSLYRCLARGARAAFQLYPENLDQRELIVSSAMRAGFSGGIVVDFPNRKPDGFHFRQAQAQEKAANNKKGKGERMDTEEEGTDEKKGNVVPPDTKYTARKRKSRF
ncbi:hypothetical protein M0R45_018927 [Rubus argutus]|uniref:18S rRNA (guanine(1575)-N(7))-methyltransferase Bud23 C-terminal domain-containing protein n=1 Tax=Rubus argutus TaxID=59490 RepID=A0AAW1X4C6_RUBAR